MSFARFEFDDGKLKLSLFAQTILKVFDLKAGLIFSEENLK